MDKLAQQIIGEAIKDGQLRVTYLVVHRGGFSFTVNFGYAGDLVNFLNSRDVPYWVRSQIEHQLADGIDTMALDGYDEVENDDEGVYVAKHAGDAAYLINAVFGTDVPHSRGMFHLPSHAASKEVQKLLAKVGIEAELNNADEPSPDEIPQ